MDAYPDEDYRREQQLIHRLFTGRPYITIALIGVCAVLWAMTCLSLSHPLDIFRMPVELTMKSFGAQINGGAEQYQLWRLFSAAFLHFGLVHLGFNCYALWVIGSFQERFLGRGRFLLVYMTSALTGGLATLWLLAPEQESAGASGAVFGLLGAQLAFEFLKTLPAPLQRRSMWKGVLPWIVFNLALGVGANHFSTEVQLNNFAHLGGLFGGFAVAMLLRGRPAEADERIGPAAVVGWLLAVVALVCCGIGVWNGVSQDPQYLLFGHPL